MVLTRWRTTTEMATRMRAADDSMDVTDVTDMRAPQGARRVSRRALLLGAMEVAAAGSLAGTAGLGYSAIIEPGWIERKEVRLILPRLSPAFDGYRIAQMSDLHLGDWLTPDRLADVVRQVNALGANLIAITGDFVTRHAIANAPDLEATLRHLHARDGVVAILGNHDHWSSAGAIREVIRASGARDLSNAVHTLERGGALLHIAGVDDIWEGKNRLDLVLGKLPREGAAVLLAHEPDYADESAATERFDAQISGHSHGGQIVAPFYGPLHLPYLGHRYPLGLYRVGRMWQYTNRGIGMLKPWVRFNCRPEITVFTLKAAS